MKLKPLISLGMVLLSGIALSCFPAAGQPASKVIAWGYGGTSMVFTDLTDVVEISAGSVVNLALRSDGSAVGRTLNWKPLILSDSSSNIVAIATCPVRGEWFGFTVGLKADGTVAELGYHNSWIGYDGNIHAPSGLSNVIAIAAGLTHALALKRDGTVIAWGTMPFTVTNVPTGLTNVVAIAAGDYYGLALIADGTVIPWGYYSYYFGSTNVPASVSNIVAIAAGTRHAIGLKEDGRVVAWGSDFYGGFYSATNVPKSLSNVVAIASGGTYDLALRRDGTVISWGYSGYGSIAVPTSLTNVGQISAGLSHSMALIGDGPPFLTTILPNQTRLYGSTVWVRATATGAWPLTYQWSFNGTNVLGATNALLVLKGVGLKDAGAYSVIVSNAFGEVTSSDMTLNVVPLSITSQPRDRIVYGGETVTLESTAVGEPPLSYQWRFNGADLLSETNSTLVLTNLLPNQAGLYSVAVSNAYGVAISSNAMLGVIPLGIITQPQSQSRFEGQAVSLSVTAAGVAPWSYQWQVDGNNLASATDRLLVLTNVQASQSGKYSVLVSNTYTTVKSANAILSIGLVAAWSRNLSLQTNLPYGLTNAIAIAAKANGSLALKADGSVVAWGDNYCGQTNVPPGLTNAVAIAAGACHNLALTSSGTLVGWGENSYGQAAAPIGLTNMVAIAAGDYHSAALKSDGTVVAWGFGSYGQTYLLTGLTSVIAVACGASHTVALTSDGRVGAWGGNSIGINTATVPPDLSNVVAIACGDYHSLALLANGTARSWGNLTTVPTNVVDVIAIAAGGNHDLALKRDGSLLAWGGSGLGQTNIPTLLTNIVGVACGRLHNLALIGDGSPALSVPLVERTAEYGATTWWLVAAAGKRPLTYQWKFNGADIPGATDALLALPDLQFSQAGVYSVAVSNSLGSVISQGARLTVFPEAISQSITLNEDTSLPITLRGADLHGDPLIYALLSGPSNGTLGGTPPNLTYRPATNYFGGDSFTFKVNDGRVDSPPATVSILVLPVNDPPVAVAEVSPLLAILPGETNLFLLSPNNTNATVVLDGSRSWDVENDELKFYWYGTGGTNLLALGSIATNVLTVGRHSIDLVVSDGQASGTNRICFEIITPGAAVAQVMALVQQSNLELGNKQPLLASLNAAAASFERGNFLSAINQLNAFENQVRDQLAPTDPVAAKGLIEAVQALTTFKKIWYF